MKKFVSYIIFRPFTAFQKIPHVLNGIICFWFLSFLALINHPSAFMFISKATGIFLFVIVAYYLGLKFLVCFWKYRLDSLYAKIFQNCECYDDRINKKLGVMSWTDRPKRMSYPKEIFKIFVSSRCFILFERAPGIQGRLPTGTQQVLSAYSTSFDLRLWWFLDLIVTKSIFCDLFSDVHLTILNEGDVTSVVCS